MITTKQDSADKVGTVQKIEFTQGGAGNQWTTIDGVKYATWWDIRTKNWSVGDAVNYKTYMAPSWHGHPALLQASILGKVS